MIPLVDPAVGAILVVEFDEVVADVDHLRLAVVALDPRGFFTLGGIANTPHFRHSFYPPSLLVRRRRRRRAG